MSDNDYFTSDCRKGCGTVVHWFKEGYKPDGNDKWVGYESEDKRKVHPWECGGKDSLPPKQSGSVQAQGATADLLTIEEKLDVILIALRLLLEKRNIEMPAVQQAATRQKPAGPNIPT